ncbi:hypothetical protein CC2G_011786 [Coprinopsis cinerea AmutBmut pab1-1]|nr:hypothetical protein CC2G_011786 [Coprinopsis cinerea AmutBmut pab1-1]
MNPPNRDEETGDARQQTPVQIRPRSNVPSFLFLSFLLFMLTSHNGDEFLARHQHQDALKALTWQLSNYTAWMNGTESNFTIPERDPTLEPLLDSFNVQGEELDPLQSSYFQNITGFIHGKTQFYNLTSPAVTLNDTLPWRAHAENYVAGLNLTEATDKWGEWKWNTSTKAVLSLVEKKPLGMDEKVITQSNLALVHGRIELVDTDSSKDIHFEFEGVHFLSNGSIYGFAEPPGRRIDIRLLPSLVPEDFRNETAAVIAPELNARINKLKNLIDAGVLDQDSNSDDPPKTTCPFSFFAHINPIPVPEFLMEELEEEIQNPTGLTTISPPKLSINGVLVSKECGILYTLHDTDGLRSRTFFRKMTTYAGMSGLCYLALLILFSRQLERSRNPSGISRASRWTFLSQATMDSVSFAGHITFAIIAEGKPSMSLTVPAFLACVLFLQEAQFFALVNQIQGSETSVLTPAATIPTAPPPAAPSPSPQPQQRTPHPHHPLLVARPGKRPAALRHPPAAGFRAVEDVY